MTRRGLIVAFCAAAGCVSGTGVEGFPEPDEQETPADSGTDPDSNDEPTDVPCPAENVLDLGASMPVGLREMDGVDGVELIGFEAALADSTFFELYLWREDSFENGFYAGTFELTLEPFCSACAALDSPHRLMQARSGTLVIAEVSRSRLRGAISDVTLVEVDEEIGRPIAGGCTAVVGHDFDVALPAGAELDGE